MTYTKVLANEWLEKMMETAVTGGFCDSVCSSDITRRDFFFRHFPIF